MKFWDASALVPLFVNQSNSKLAKKLYESDSDMIVWWGTILECESALARLQRLGELTKDHYDAARQKLHAFSAEWMEVKPGEEIRRHAVRLLRLHSLRAADAMQLAALITVTGRADELLEFVCLDKQLRDAANLEGYAVAPEGIER